MYSSYYAKTAQAMAQANCPSSRTSPYQRSGPVTGGGAGAMPHLPHYPTHPGATPSCYQNFPGASSAYTRGNYDYAANTPR